MTIGTPVYLDNHATTAPDPAVLELMQRVARDHYGNPDSAGHAYGWAAAQLIEDARVKVAALVGATPREIVFCSGATEADNMAILGSAAVGTGPGHIVTTVMEHAAVNGPLAWLESRGWRLTRVGCGPDGVMDPSAVAAAIDRDTKMVSCIAAQNEIGTIQPLGEIGLCCKKAGVVFHSDAAQAAGRIAVDVVRDGIDLLSLSAHKLHGPKGIGALYVRRRDPRVVLAPLWHGGNQERGLRPGTPDVAGIAGFGEACRLAAERMEADAVLLQSLADRLLKRLGGRLEGWMVNGDRTRRLPGSLNLSFSGVRAHSLLGAVTQLAVSSGSACSSAESAPSPVLLAIGLSQDLAAASLRLAFSRNNVPEEADFAADVIAEAVGRLRLGTGTA